jgi:NTP pyrophosphatase (non-canonical NTP hydrolase)
MTFDEYQKLSRKTAIYPSIGKGYIYPVLGLVGESGELVNKVKKIHRDDMGKVTNKRKKAISKELGDMLWYIAQVATEFDLSLSKIAKDNIDKLLSRKERGTILGDGDNR